MVSNAEFSSRLCSFDGGQQGFCGYRGIEITDGPRVRHGSATHGMAAASQNHACYGFVFRVFGTAKSCSPRLRPVSGRLGFV